MTKLRATRRLFLTTTAAAFGLAALGLPDMARAQALKGGTLRVGIRGDMANYDPQQLSSVNFWLIKQLYDSIIEYTEAGEAVPSLGESWTIAPDNKSVTVKLRSGVTFHSGAPLNAAAVDATLKKGSDPKTGKMVFPTMSIIESWSADDDLTFTIKFHNPVPDKQITDFLQFLIPIDPAIIDKAETEVSGTGPFTLAGREVGQSVTMKKNPNYWRENEPILDEVVFTIFADDASAAAALESGALDVYYNGQVRTSVRLRDAGFPLILGPGKLVQVFRINSTRGPFQNKQFRQAFNYLMNREAMLKVGYAGLGVPVALPWASSNPAFDESKAAEHAYNIDKAKELLAASGLTQAQMEDWKILANGGDEAAMALAQIVQESLKEAGLNVQLAVQQGSEFTDSMLQGNFDAMFGGVGNTQKFPSRIITNSIYRIKGNPVLGDPNPHTAYVDAINRVDNSFGDDVKPAYDNLNAVLLDESFAIPTNTLETGQINHAPNVDGLALDIDNLLVLRSAGFK